MTLLLLLACAGGADTGGCVTDADGAHPTWGTFGQAFFLDYCASCHAATTPQRFGAPESVTFDTEAEVVAQLDAVRRTVLETGTMPVGGGVTEADLAGLDRYLDCLDAGPW